MFQNIVRIVQKTPSWSESLCGRDSRRSRDDDHWDRDGSEEPRSDTVDESVRAIRATLSPLGQRIPAGNAEDLAASLVPDSDFQQLRDQLLEGEDGENWGKLFAVVDADGWERRTE